jgi:hypothetical protein
MMADDKQVEVARVRIAETGRQAPWRYRIGIAAIVTRMITG